MTYPMLLRSRGVNRLSKEFSRIEGLGAGYVTDNIIQNLHKLDIRRIVMIR